MKKGFHFTLNSHFTVSACRQLSRLGLVAALVVGSWSFGFGQNASATWGANGSTAWYSGANWAGSAYAGVQGSTASANSYIATFTSAFTGTTPGINMTTSSLNLGAISIDNTRITALNVGNSGATAGSLFLHGATVNAVANTILRNNGTMLFTVQAAQNGTMSVVLSNSTDNIINTDGAGGIVISAVISGGSNKLTKTGTGALQLTGANTYTGLTTVNSGTLQFSGVPTLPSTNSVTLTSGGTLKISADQTLSNLTVPTGATLLIDAGATLTVTGTSTIAGTLTLNGTLTNNGTMTITSSVAAATGSLVQGTSAGLTFGTGGTWPSSTPTLTASAASNTVTYSGANQTIKGTTYNNLIISGTGTKSLNNGATVFNSDFTVPSGLTFVTNGQALTFNGNYTFSGTTATFTSSSVTIGGTATTQSISGFSTTGGITMSKTAGTATFTGNVTGSSLTINGIGGTLNLGSGLTHTMTNTNANNGWVRTNGTLNGGSSTLILAGNGSGSGGTFTAGTGTVEYNSVSTTNTQTIATVTYNNLVLTSATSAVTGNTKTLGGTASVDGNLTINTNVILSHTAQVLTLKGAFTNNGTGVYTGSSTSTLTFGGITAQSITGTTPTIINLIVASGATLNLTAAQSTGTLSINSGGILTTTATVTVGTTATINGTFQINQGGYATGGTWTYSGANATLVYNNTSGPYGAIDNSHVYWPSASGPTNVTVQGGGGINMGVSRTVSGTFLLVTGSNAVQGTALTLNGTIQINGGNFQSTPTYGSSSTLIYNTGTSYGVNNEWTGNSTTAGSGIPRNVTIQGSSTINMPNSDRGMGGNLNITSGSLVLNSSSGDLYVAGNWTRASTATFTPNNRAVFFNGGNAKTLTVTGGGTETFNYLILTGSNTVQLATGTNMAVTASDGLTLSSTSVTSTLDLNGQTLTHSGGGNLSFSSGARRITSTVAGGTFIVSGSNLTVTSGGSLVLGDNVATVLSVGMNFGSGQTTFGGGTSGTLQLNSGGFVNTNTPTYANSSTLIYNNPAGYTVGIEWGSGTTTGAGVPNNVTVLQGTVVLPASARSVPGTLTMTSGALTLTNGGNLTVSTTLALSASKITTNNAKVILPSSASLTRSTGYVVGNLQKNVATGANVLRTFEIGDASNYTPLSITFANVSTAGDVTASTTASVHPNVGTSSLHATKFINRYWTLSSVSTAFDTYQAVFTYVSGDVQGSANTSNLIIGRYASSAWTYPSVSNSGFTTTGTGLTAFGDFALAENGCVNPTAYTVTGGGAYCSGGTGVAIGLSNSETGVTYQLILGVANDGSPISGTGAISFGLKTTAGTYTVLGTRTSGGCSTAMTGNAVVSINARPTESHTKVDDNCQVNAGSITITVSDGLAPYSIVWSSGGLPNGNISTSGGTLTVSSLTGGVSYIFTATDNNGCTAQ